jgi:hypothetical protein
MNLHHEQRYDRGRRLNAWKRSRDLRCMPTWLVSVFSDCHVTADFSLASGRAFSIRTSVLDDERVALWRRPPVRPTVERLRHRTPSTIGGFPGHCFSGATRDWPPFWIDISLLTRGGAV